MKRRSHREEGMTLIEVMVVVIILGLIAAGVAIHVVGSLDDAKIRMARTNAMTVRTAVLAYLIRSPGDDCPSVDALVEHAILDGDTSTTDPWERPFRIECEGSRVRVFSAGPDGEDGTDDDIEGRRR